MSDERTDIDELETDGGADIAPGEPAAASKPEGKGGKSQSKASKSSKTKTKMTELMASLTIPEIQKLMNAMLDISTVDNPAETIKERVKRDGMVYLTENNMIYGVVFSENEYNRLTRK